MNLIADSDKRSKDSDGGSKDSDEGSKDSDGRCWVVLKEYMRV